jgi:hypothetical protein
MAKTGGVAHLDDPGAGLDQLAEHRALADDPGVVAGVGRGGHRGDQGVQVRGAADPGDLPALGELARDGDRVGRVAASVQVQDRVVDDLVRRPVEVVGVQDLDDLGDGVGGQQHPADHALLGGDVVRWSAFELLLRTPLPSADEQPRLLRRGPFAPRLPDASDILRASAPGEQRTLWTNLWTACADTPCRLCTTCGKPWG